MHLPARGSSHGWQKRGAAQAAQRAWDAVAHDRATATAVRLGTRQVEPLVSGAAQDGDACDAQPCAAAVQRPWSAQPMQGLTVDGKGGVMRPAAWREATRKQAEARAQRAPHGLAHKDPSHRPRLATVAGISPLDRPLRSPHTGARPCAPLRRVPSHPPPAPTPVGTKRWARLAKPMQAVLEAPVAAGRRRDPAHKAAGVACVDGDPTHIDALTQTANASGVRVVLLLESMHGLA